MMKEEGSKNINFNKRIDFLFGKSATVLACPGSPLIGPRQPLYSERP